MNYDPDVAPDQRGWLELDEDARTAACIAAHADAGGDAMHPDGVTAMHLSLHVVVETQIALGEPPQAVRTMVRLVEQSVRRHLAVHLIMEVLVAHMARLVTGKAFDDAGYAADLEAIEASDGLARAMKRAATRVP